MGKMWAALFGKSFRASKFKALLNMALSRLSILKNQHQSRCSLARSDVVHLLKLGHQDGALIRIERVMTEQNQLDVLVMIEGYCIMLIERVSLIKQEKDCPDELKEATSSLVYAATRCGDFPELQEIRAVISSHFGKELATRSAQLRNNCGVNPKMIQKLSTRHPSMESKLKVLKEIASTNHIVLEIEGPSTETTEENIETEQTPNHTPKHESQHTKDGNNYQFSLDKREIEEFSDSMVARPKYKDVAHAAQAAFESAAYAAVAARAAVELARADDHNNRSPQKGASNVHEFMKIKEEEDNIDDEIKSEGLTYTDTDSNVSDNLQDISSDIMGMTVPLEPVHTEKVSEDRDHETTIESNQTSPSTTRDVDLEKKGGFQNE